MSSIRGSGQSRKKTYSKLISRIAYSVWFLGIYWSLVGDEVMPPEALNQLLQQARGILRGLLVLLVVLALWPLVLGIPLDVPEGRRRRFVALASVLALVNLILEAMERNMPALGVGSLTLLFVAAVAVLLLGTARKSTRKGKGAWSAIE